MISLFKFGASIIFIWIHNPYNNLYNFGESVKSLYKVKSRSDLIFQRSLAKHVPKKEFSRSSVKNKLLENNSFNNAQGTAEDLSKYSQLKKKGLNDLDLYKKLYKHRYSKSNVLGKFDCYCEKKIFDKFDYINELKEKLRHDKRSFNKSLHKIFDIPLILFGLVPLFGLIIPLLKNEYFSIIKGCFSDCKEPTHLKSEGAEPKPHQDIYNVLSIDKDTWGLISYVNCIFWCTAGVVIICVFLYILIKIIKYKKLIAGRDKMSLKEYCHFIKNLI